MENLNPSPPQSSRSDFTHALQVARTAMEMDVIDHLTATSCASALGVIRGAVRQADGLIKDARTEEEARMREAVAQRVGDVVEARRELNEADEALEKKLTNWRRAMDVVAVDVREHQKRQREARYAATQEVQPEDYIPPAPTVYDTPNGRVCLVKRWKFSVIDLGKVPEEYTVRVLDRKKVWKAIYDGTRSIPGLDIEQDDTTTFSETTVVAEEP